MRKNLFRTLTFAALFCILLIVSVFAEEAVVTGSDVNFRSGPSSDYAIFERLPKGTVVTVTDRSDSEWYAVTYNGQSGYINSAYLSISSAPAAGSKSQPAVTQTEGRSGTVNAMYVRFRSGPGTDYSILDEYNRGTALTVTGSSGSWYAVVINGTSGYMYSDYVTVGGSVDPAPAATPKPTTTPAPAAPIQVTSTGNQAGHISGDYVYFRSGPSKYYSIYDCLSSGTALTITGRSGEWYAVTINGTSGFVYSAYVVNDDGGSVPDVSTPAATPAPTPVPTPVPQADTGVSGYITGNDVRFRSGPGTRYDILGEYNYGTALTITGSSGEWKAVIINGRSGYVYGQYVAQGSASSVSDDPNSSALGKQIVEFALRYQGYNYTWGGTSPETGFDCSGFTTFVYGHFGIELHRVACDQASYDGVRVSNSSLQQGDLLCFYSSSNYVGHVGIYIGNNRFIHSSTYTTGVIISDLSGYYDTRGYIAKRLA
ncbi:MAG: SH3 domain-containing protein [Oscillospiraceae bacterium]|nr:SH3 domain-containing protein [Oscillospiraceae bacterium]